MTPHPSSLSVNLPLSDPSAPRPRPVVSVEDVLWDRLRAGDMQAREALLTHFAPLVRQVVGRMKVRHILMLDQDDLEGVGAIGLIKAVDRFDSHHGVKFETYAYHWIQGHVIDHVRRLDVLTRTSREKVTRLKKKYRELRESLGREPHDWELSEHTGLNIEELNKVYFDMGSTESISIHAGRSGAGDDGENANTAEDTWPDQSHPGPPQLAEQREASEALKRGIDTLPEKERLVISLYYVEEFTLKEIGVVLGVSESRVCQLHSKAILALQTALAAAPL